MIEYVLLICWMIAVSLCVGYKDRIVILMGAVFIGYSSGVMFYDYPDLYGNPIFIVFSTIIILLGVYRSFK